MTVHDVLLQYQGKLQEAQQQTGGDRPEALSLYAIRGQLSPIWSSLSIPVIIIVLRRLRKNRQDTAHLLRLKRFYNRAVQRVSGDWASRGPAGPGFNDPQHVYDRDLDV